MSNTKYTKSSKKSNSEQTYTKIAYHIQEARKHLDSLSTSILANEVGLTKQGLQLRIDNYKKEVANNA